MFTAELQPPLEAVRRAPPGVPVAVHRAVPADVETPVSIYLKLRSGRAGFLLESAEQDGSLGRYSFIGTEPDLVLRAGAAGGTIEAGGGVSEYAGAPLEALRRLAGEATPYRLDDTVPGFTGGLVGALGYDLGRALEGLPATLPDDTAFPAAIFGLYRTVVVFDHLKQRLLVVSLVSPDGPREEAYRAAAERVDGMLARIRTAAAPVWLEPVEHGGDAARLLETAVEEPAAAAFLEAVKRAREYVHAGDVIQVVLSRRIALPFEGDAFRAYRALRMVNPSPYMFFLEFPELALVGASPEMLLRVERDAAQVAPIAGTRPRGAEAADDAALEAELMHDAKERAEHLMLVDLGRNDLGRVCRAGTVHVPRFMQVERYSHVMHLVSTVTGRLAQDVDAIDALAACFPAGTLTGAPKVRAMELIEELETARRGAYGGAVGYIGFGGTSLDTCITIRTVVVRNGTAHVQVGAGIVADSDPVRELEETSSKARALLAALALAGTAARAREDASHRPEVHT